MTARSAGIATDRAALLLQLVPYLIGKGEVPLADAAADFDVTEAQMRAMVEKLTVLGRPGDGGFWQMSNDLFDIDWDLLDSSDTIAITNTVGLERAPRLSAREAAALLAGLQLAGTIPGVADSQTYRGVLAKLARGSSETPAEVIVASEPVDAVRDAVADALRRGVAVRFTYQAPDAPATTRTVDPVKVQIALGQWYLQGWCHLRRAMRTFHLDRVSDLELTDLPISHAGEPVPDWFENTDADVPARIRFPASLTPLLTEYLERADVIEDGENRVASLRIADVTSLRRLAARGGGHIEVLEPADARQATAEWARAGLSLYR